MTIANTVSAQQLRAFIERVERIDTEVAEAKEQRKAVLQEAKSEGFDTKAIGRMLKRRKMKPHDLQEAEAIDAMYQHALGMAEEPPLIRAMRAAEVDPANAESVLANLKKFCPVNGSVEVTLAGKTWIIARNKDGEAEAVEKLPEADMRRRRDDDDDRPARRAESVAPDVDLPGARALGVEAGRDNQPVISNPFPFGDARRPAWDEGWTEGAGHDGMGPKK